MNTPLVRYQHNLASGTVVCLLVGFEGIVTCPGGAFAAEASKQKANKTVEVSQKTQKANTTKTTVVAQKSVQQKPAPTRSVPTKSDEPVYSVVSPLGDPTVKKSAMAPRLNTLEGKTVGMYWNHSFKADITFPAIEESLKNQYPGIKIVPYTEIDAAIRAAGGEIRTLDPGILSGVFKQKRFDAVISGNGG